MSWRRFFRRARWDDERARELESYLQIETDDNIARGMAPDEARAAAHRKLGNTTLIREDIYRMNTLIFLETLWQDVRHGARLLRFNPGFTGVALLSLTLGIGANTAIFQLLDAVRLRTIPVKNPQELVEVRIAPVPGGRSGQFNGRRPYLTQPLWEQIQARQQAVSDLFAWGTTTFDLSTEGESRFAEGSWVSGGYFPALGVTPAAGRLIGAADDTPGCPAPPAVISDRFWQKEFGRAPDAIGRTIRLDGHPIVISGVTPPGFFGVEVGRSFDVAVPLCARRVLRATAFTPDMDDRQIWWLAAFGRLKPGWPVERATASLQTLSPGLFADTVSPRYAAKEAKHYSGFILQATEAATGVSTLRRDYGQPLLLLLGIAGLVLLIACANLANLTLARASAREREIAVRLAIGASRTRIVRQLLSESLLIAALGAMAGLLVAQQLSRLLMVFLTSDGSQWSLELGLDWRLLAFSTGLAAITCVLFGLVPALRATRTQPSTVMKAGGRGLTASPGRFGLRRILVATQIAVSIVLLVGGLLFVRTFQNLATLDPGFRTQGVLTANLDLRPAGVAPEGQAEYQRQILARLSGLPGVAAASSASVIPVSGSSWNESVTVDGALQEDYPNVNRVSASFFGVMQMPLKAGRNFDRRDSPSSPPVAVVSESFVKKYLAGGSPLGRTFRFVVGPNQPDPVYEVIGVVPDTKYQELREPLGPVVFLADTQEAQPVPFMSVLLRTAGSPDLLRTPVANAAREINRGILLDFHTLDQFLADSLVRERLMASLSGGFALLAVILAVVGLYGLMSYTVATRRNEIGIRIALGATRSRVMAMIVRETSILVAVGSAVGIALAIVAARATKALLFELEPGDPVTILMAAGLLAVVAAVASIIPAQRAARVSPTTALRDQ